MTLRHLQIFKSVCNNMSVTQAADELNMTQPAVSIAIKELEAFYDTKLFDRIGRKIYLTESGEKLQGYANIITEQFSGSVSDIRDKSNFVRCRIGTNVTIAESFLASIIQELKTSMPDIELYITVDNTKAVEGQLVSNDIDFALTDAPIDTDNLITKKIYAEEMEIVCSPNFTEKNALTVKELSAFPLLLREKGSGCRNCLDATFEQHGCFPKPLVQSVSNPVLVELAEKGGGLTVLPCSLIYEKIKSGKLKRLMLSDSELTREYFLIYHKKKFLPHIVKKCINNIEDFFNMMKIAAPTP